jgi:Flp pilus assembly protein TadG
MKSQRLGSKRNHRERGMALMITAIAMLFVVPFVGLSIDAGLAYVVRGRLSAALDSAALAAGRGLNLGSDLATAQTAAIAAATSFFNANFPPGYMGTDTTNRTINATFNMQTDSNHNPNGILVIGVTGTVSTPTYFSRLLGFKNFSVSATGTATRRTLVMSLVLDISASMGTRNTTPGTIPGSIGDASSSCEAMVYSAIQFINYFTPYDYVAMIAFDYTAHLKYAPSTNFKAAGNSGVIQQIANLQCGNNTNTTAALELGYTQIKNVGLPLAENVIVLFTDGVPNGITANFPVRTQVDTRLGPSGGSPTPSDSPTGNQANCLDGSGTKVCQNMPVACAGSPATVHGVITQTANFDVTSGQRGGLYKAFDTDSSPTFPSGCPTSGITMVNQTIAYIPDTDAFGNSTHGPWDGWLYKVNNQCAPSGTPITSGNSSCKYLGDAWSNNAGIGAGAPSNFFQSGPYKDKFRPDLANTIGVTSMNSAVNEANKIRSDTTYKITIDTVYLQGNGSDPVDRRFLQIVSNQLNIQQIIYETGYPHVAAYPNTYYQSTQQQGLWLATANATDLNSLFAQVASSLLRISQ